MADDTENGPASSPLLGTKTFQNIGNVEKSPLRGPIKHVCYTNLLHSSGSKQPEKPQKTAKNRSRNCYTALLHNVPNGLCVRSGRFYYRRRIPHDVRELTGRTEIWRSLGTDSLIMAKRRLAMVAAEIEAQFENVRFTAGHGYDEALLKPFGDRGEQAGRLVTSKPTVSNHDATPTLTLGEAYDRYLSDPTHTWSARTREAYETSRRLAVSVIGAEIPMADISRVHCREYLEVLRYMPRNAAKLFPNLTAREASEKARLNPDIKVMSPANANVCLANLSSFLNWAVNEDLLARNPARGLRLPDDIAKRDKRNPFSADQLLKIFNAPLYIGCMDGERGYANPGDQRPRNARFWVPLIALHTGCRLNEICQLDVTDIRLIDGVHCIVISEKSLVGTTDKSLKTGVSERIIPLHRNLLDCGLASYANQVSRAGEKKLFHDIDPGYKGIRGVAFSKWFTQFLRNAGAAAAKTCFHSFRHNFRDELRAARIDHNLSMALGGWTTGKSGKSAASDNYGNGYGIGDLHHAICKLEFANLDLSHLKP